MPRLRHSGHRVTRLLRRRAGDPPSDARDSRLWDPSAGTLDPRVFDGIDAVVHLGGASIGSLWTASRKELLRSSRIETTRLLAETMATAPSRPAVLVHASGVGYYGDRGDEVLTESSAPGRGFLAELCRDWESASMAAQDAGVRVVHLRTGLVLSRNGGVLPLMLRPFRLGLGGRLGSGRQWMSWIGLGDVIRVYDRVLTDDALRGAVNAVAPEPVTNATLTRALAQAVHRPAMFPVPEFVIRMIPGGMGSETLLVSQRVIPGALAAAGFPFETPTVEGALAASRATSP